MSKKVGLKSRRSMLKTVEEGENFLKKQWGKKKLKQVEDKIEERQRKLEKNEPVKRRSSKDSEHSETPEPPTKKVKTTASTSKAKLTKTRTMAATTKVY